jgi:hypothetical protein
LRQRTMSEAAVFGQLDQAPDPLGRLVRVDIDSNVQTRATSLDRALQN